MKYAQCIFVNRREMSKLLLMLWSEQLKHYWNTVGQGPFKTS